MVKLTFEIRLDANYHVGAGYGQGFDVDSALLREGDGIPVLRGSTLAGLLRDGAERLLKLPPLAKHSVEVTLARLFGSPAQIKRWRISSAHPEKKRDVDSLTVRRVRIDPLTRRAEPQKLFSQEEGLKQNFRFEVTCPYNDADVLDEVALLVAAARNVRQLGRSRRRGLGECVFHLVDVNGFDEIQKPIDQSWEEWFLELFNQTWMQGPPKEAKRSTVNATNSNIQDITTFNDEIVRLRITVRLDEPLLIAQRASAGNQFDTVQFIPGSTVRGALAAMAAGNFDLADPDIYRDFVSLFLRGGITFPVLYPALYYQNNIYPAIPIPMGLLTCSVAPFMRKNINEGHGIFLAWQDNQDSREDKKCSECHNRLEPVSGFIVLKRYPDIYLPQQNFEMHVRINEKTQRAAKGDLYGYTVLSAGQYFVGEMLCAGEAAWQRLQELTGIAEKTPLTWWLGKGRQRGYGQVTAWLERCDDFPQTWIQLPLEQRVPDPGQPITLTLLTDSIIANSWGQQVTGFTQDWLEPVLGLGAVDICDAFARIRVVEGFNATLGLPRWRDTALVAGSVVRICLKDPPTDWMSRMKKLEAEGIGIRRNEGFGCIAFNHPIYEQLCKQNNIIRESAISLNDKMERRRYQSRDQFQEFKNYWEDKLKDFLPQGSHLDDRFAVLARWLYAHSAESPEEIWAKLSVIGLPDKDLAMIRLIKALGGHQEFIFRKQNFFRNEGKDHIEKIGKLLEKLQQEESMNWREGIILMAEWISNLVKRGE
ncbi:RAMP superfamily CRISPR-associated protein [Thermincola potens]|uniref:CRISPR type III-associated protein domain-containing protein n=1 Tax=Thermincola potens (strain JR) TaxID=635013 RepID=D5XAW2_THEPJ|nr:RAMP superfamily CRISPR-associated protein [Thermincola potens]ADG83316.1 protein of unknown function DUF324 [Thermincola potens JR]